MLGEKQCRIWELALENLENRNRQLDQAISELRVELQREVVPAGCLHCLNRSGYTITIFL